MQPACFLTWIKHRRSRELSRRLGLELAELTTAHWGTRRYLELIPRTAKYLCKQRPRTLMVQSPSLVLVMLTLLSATMAPI